MPDNINLPEDEQKLQRLYRETVEHHNAYLDKLHKAFDRRCEEIGAESKKKLAEIPEDDEEARGKIIQEEKDMLNKTLEELKFAVNKSSSFSWKKLEEIQNKMEARVIDLERELGNL